MKVAVLPVYFNDAPRVTSHTREQIEGYLANARAYYEQQSGGREHLEYQVYDWFMVPISGPAFDGLGFTAGDTILPLFPTGNGPKLSSFEHFILLIDKENSHSGAWRTGDSSHRYCHISAQDLDPALLTHELGHLAGAGHSFLQTPFLDIEYGDTFCVMGGEDVKFTYSDALGNSGPGLTASMLRVCGWLAQDGPFAVNLGLGARAEAQADLAPMTGAPPAGSPAHAVVAWSDDVAGDKRLLIEFRVRSGYDRGMPVNGSGPGWIVAHLSAGNGSAGSPVLAGSIGANAGATLEVPAASVSIRVLAVEGNHVTLKVTRRIRQVFAGDDGVIYAISDTGDLFWYRHDGHANGSFTWADTRARKVASGWNFKHVFSGGGGVIYAIDDANDLFWYRHDGRGDGSFRWADPNARKVGVGWDPRRIFSGGGGVIYTLNDVDELQWFHHDGHDDGSFRWTDPGPRKVGVGWTPKHVFPGPDGVIYTINDVDELQWFHHDGHDDGSFRWTDPNPRTVGIGWHFQPRSDPGPTVIYGINADHELVWFRHDGHEDGAFRWRFDQARVVGAGWDLRQVFSGDNGVIYGINAAGVLQWYRHDGQVNGSFYWTSAPVNPDGTVQNCGIGWNVKHVFAGADGVIYAITTTNELLWFRHDGRSDGTFRWADTKGRTVGSGWDVKHVFAGDDGVIYVINAANELLWYRHVGHRDGTFRWTDEKGRKVGNGWDVKHVFSGGEGVIYAITAANDLLWYRHEGRRDGSFRWADDKGRKVGVGWDFSQVFGG